MPAERQPHQPEQAGDHDGDGGAQALALDGVAGFAPCAQMREILLHGDHRFRIVGIDAERKDEFLHGGAGHFFRDVADFAGAGHGMWSFGEGTMQPPP